MNLAAIEQFLAKIEALASGQVKCPRDTAIDLEIGKLATEIDHLSDLADAVGPRIQKIRDAADELARPNRRSKTTYRGLTGSDRCKQIIYDQIVGIRNWCKEQATRASPKG